MRDLQWMLLAFLDEEDIEEAKVEFESRLATEDEQRGLGICHNK